MLREEKYRTFIDGTRDCRYSSCTSSRCCAPRAIGPGCICCTGPQGPTGATGSTGAAGASILGSYNTLAELIAAHPTATHGDAYLAGGELYVWNAATNQWENMGRLIGPTGATGAAGATILGSYNTLAELIAAHPTGTQGDAYLAGGELYVWNADTNRWENMGRLIGPTGPTGAAGASILGSYNTFDELRAAHPTATHGDAYLAGGELYVWNAGTNQWENMGRLIGPTGPTGSTGATGAVGEAGADGLIGQIEGVVQLITDLPTTGVEQGAIYYVEENDGVYVWDDAAGEWKMISIAQGPRGATGPIGPTGPTGADGIMGPIAGVVDSVTQLPATGMAQGTLYYVENDGLYVWDAAGGWIKLDLVQGPRGITGPTGATGQAGADATSVAIIPFASQQAPHVGTDNGGEAVNVAPIGFGYMEYTAGNAEVAIEIDTNDKSFNMSDVTNRQLAFSLPFDMTLNSIYITVGNWTTFFLPPTGTLVFPYVQLYAAPAGSNTFLPIGGAVAKPEQGIDPAVAAAATMRSASVEGLSINLRAGTRLAICGMMEITGDDEGRNYYFYFTGGIGLSRWVR